MLHDFPQVFEIQQQPGSIQFAPSQRDSYIVIVAVWVLTLSLVITQIVSGCECIVYGDFVHPSLASSGDHTASTESNT
jgi:hypothetical protein